jgi:hypothetical protein
MSVGAHAGAAGAAAAMIAQATKASGVIVRVESDDFLALLDWNEAPLAVHARGGFWGSRHDYLTSYRGLAFYTRSKTELRLPEHCQVVEAGKIWIPS